ncbi:MAG TPA: winged helix-turn-helix domain-containing protein [Planosporangium sp.]|nr:winged helix-turn-helix domain-containing protein [Planosporangium sp.]
MSAERPISHVTLDVRSLRGLAHPLRTRLLGLLRADGPSTATRLAERLGLSSGATSYHLRQLAAYGFVTDATDRGGAGRERWWRAVHQVTQMRAADLGPEAADLTDAYLRGVAGIQAEQVQRALDEWPTRPERWRRAETLSDFSLRLTAEELTRLQEEMFELIRRYRYDDPERADDAPPDSAPVVLQVQAFVRPGAALAGEEA